MPLGRIYKNLVEKDLDFYLGQVTQVFLKPEDGNVRDDVTSQQLHLQPLDSSLPTMGKQILATPLMRGMSDSVTKGDLVIFTLIYKRAFYIGPVNSFNLPNNSSNPSYSPLRTNLGQRQEGLVIPGGYGTGYPATYTQKLQKDKSINLDNLPTGYYNTSKHTDMLFEGRHGNAIRIGSRATNPHMIISNGNLKSLEDPMLGSVIGILSNGSIEQNFYPSREQDTNAFRLSTDSSANTKINQSYQIGIGNDNGLENLETIYNFSKDLPEEASSVANQILITSDKITMDARSDRGDFTISSGRNINIGAAQNFTLNNQGNSVINSGNIYLGVPAKSKKEPLVLGDQLRALLLDIMNILQGSRALVQGVPIPFVDQNSEPMFQRIQNLINELQPREEDENKIYQDDNIVGKRTRFLSKHHFIEINKREQNNEG
jgi:hypothetical protein